MQLLLKSDIKRCSACQGPFHPATGHSWGKNVRLCHSCTKNWMNWLKGREASLSRPWRKPDSSTSFLDAATSSNIPVKKSLLFTLLNKSEVLDTKKLDSNPWTLYSKVFQEKSFKGLTMSKDKAIPINLPIKASMQMKAFNKKETEDSVADKENKAEKSQKIISAMMTKAKEDTDKARLGSFTITPKGPIHEKTGQPLRSILKQEAKTKEILEAMPKPKSSGLPQAAVTEKSMDLMSNSLTQKQVMAGIDKAMTSMSLPRVTRGKALAMDTFRSATAVMTRGNSKFAKDIHTGPLTGEVIQDLTENSDIRTRSNPVYKSCNSCGRIFMAKSQDAECPTCSINKSSHCVRCGQNLVKGRGGWTYCPLCK